LYDPKNRLLGTYDFIEGTTPEGIIYTIYPLDKKRVYASYEIIY
jgi:hypothetical protein